MPYDGSGNFTRVHDWTADEAAGIKVRADRFDAENDDFATAFENCLTRDGQGKPTANIDWNNKQITNLADPTTLKGALNVQTAQQNSYSFGTTAGGTTAYTLSLGITVPSLVDGQPFRAEINATNTGSSTLNVDSFGAKTIKVDGQDLVGGELQANSIYWFAYNAGTGFIDLKKTYLADATESIKGVVELATSAETITGTSTTLATHPSGVKAAIDSGVIPVSDKTGLYTEQDTDTDHDIKINTGACIDSTNAEIIRLTSALTKKIDVNWSAGDDGGGFPDGISLTQGIYGVFVIKNSSTGDVDAGYDSSDDASNLLADTNVSAAGYDLYRRIGYVITDASNNIIDYYQNGNRFILKTPIQDLGSTDIHSSAVLRTLTVPNNDKIRALLYVGAEEDKNAKVFAYALITSPQQNDTIPSSTIFNFGIGSSQDTLGETTSVNTSYFDLEVNTSSQIRVRWNTSQTFIRYYINTIGWIDEFII
jgi:hypothetical protein